MTTIPKPTEDMQWAESSANVTDPTGLRSGGWPVNSPLGSNHHNFLHRALGRGVRMLLSAFGDDSSQLTLGGDNGYIELTEDSGDPIDGNHVMTHVATGAGVLSETRADVVTARRGLLIMGGAGATYPDELLTTPEGMVKACGTARFESDGVSGTPTLLTSAGYNLGTVTINAGASRLEVPLVRAVPASAWGDTVLVTASPVRTGAVGNPLATARARRVIFTAEPVIVSGEVTAIHIHGTYVNSGGTELDFFSAWAAADTANFNCAVNFALI